MKLKINCDKTNVLVINKLKHEEKVNTIALNTGSEVLIPKRQIKVLGFYFNSRLSMDSNINAASKSTSYLMHSAKGVGRLMNEKTRTKFPNSHMLSRVTYGLPCYLSEKQEIKNKIHSTIMSISRWCKGSYCFRVSCSKINKSIGWDLPNQMILKSSLLFMHKILSKHQPEQIADKICLPRTRASANMCLKYQNK